MDDGKILGIDYGESKVGLAISEGEIAEPLGTLDLSSIIYHLSSLCKKEKIEKIVVGISEGKMAEKTKKFGQILEKTTGLSVEYWEETLTSREAVRKMIEAQKPRRKRKIDEHAVAAAIVLQDYLDNLPDG